MPSALSALFGDPSALRRMVRIATVSEIVRHTFPSHALAFWFHVALALLAVVQGRAAAASNHWAYQPLRSPPVPVTRDGGWARTPVDAFILHKLESEGLRPASPVDAPTLVRRLYLGMTGLPPTLQEREEFISVSGADAYERLVDRLLASARYGERWARFWMDTVHFAETHGHDQDRIRTNAWPYRDYLVDSFNADKPYDRFVREQVAGDVLFPEDPQATTALGMVAAGPWDESSLRDIREDTLDRQIGRYLDRDDMVTTVLQTFTSTTVQCARCHDHKFDPVSLREYYALQAVFAGVDRANRVYDIDPDLHRRRQEWLGLLRQVNRRERDVLLSPAATQAVAEAEQRHASAQAPWIVLQPTRLESTEGTVLSLQEDGSIVAGGKQPERDIYQIDARLPHGRATALRLEVLSDTALPGGGPGRADNGNLHLSEVEVAWISADGEKPAALAHPTADFNQEGWTIEHALDGKEETAWGIYPRVGEGHIAVFEFKEAEPEAKELRITLKQLHGRGHLIGRLRLSVTDRLPPVTAAPWPANVQQHLAVDSAQRSETARIELAAHFFKDKLERQLAGLRQPRYVYAAAAEFAPDGGLKPAGAPRVVHVLDRGNILSPLEEAAPGALGCVEALPARFELESPSEEGTRRAALAEWLAHRDNPLLWRSIVNRVWLWHFGQGLVETPNDFGGLGAPPSHPELLDWLAVWFRDEARGSLKQLHRLLVTSAVWRQSCLPHSGAEAGPELDADNRWLWRMNRRRLDAEQTRDSMLFMCDRLDLRMGGPSDQQFGLQPGIHVTPRVDYSAFDVDDPRSRRRAVYRFLFRTLPDPFMDALDCPSGDELTPVRHASVTVQQALALWNSPFVARHAELLASRLALGRSDASGPAERPATERGLVAEQVGLAFEVVLGRAPSAQELTEFAGYVRDHGLANLCRLLLNSNEFMFVN